MDNGGIIDDYSKTALMTFIEMVGKKHYVTSNVAKNWRLATARLLTDLSEDEEADVRKINLEFAARRAMNRDPNALTSESLSSYKARAANAIQQFLDFQSDPLRYQGPSNRPQAKPNGDHPNRQSHKATPGAAAPHEKTKETPTPVDGLSYSYPLRSDFLVSLVLPRDLKVSEAKRLGKFMEALAVDADVE